MKILILLFIAFPFVSATDIFAQDANKTLKGKVLYQSSGNKPAVGVRIAEPDANPVYSVDNGQYVLHFQNKRNGASLALEVGKDDNKGQKIELVNEKEIKNAKLPADPEYILEVIVCPAGHRDVAAQKYYKILRTTADRELEKKKVELSNAFAQQKTDYKKIMDLSAQINDMQRSLDSAKIRQQAMDIASINLDRASTLVREALQKIGQENDVEGALQVLSTQKLNDAYRQARQEKDKVELEIRQVIEGYKLKISLLEQEFRFEEMALCNLNIADIYENEHFKKTELANYLNDAATNFEKTGAYSEALKYHKKALTIRETELGAEHPETAISYNNLGVVYTHLGQYEQALAYHEKGNAIWEKTEPVNRLQLARNYNNTGGVYYEMNDYKKALSYHEKGLAIREVELGSNHPDVAHSLSNIVASCNYTGDYTEALECGKRAIAILETSNPKHPELARTYGNVAGTYYYLEDYAHSLEYLKKGLDIYEAVYHPRHPDLAVAYFNLGGVCRKAGDSQQSLIYYEKALNIYENTSYSDWEHLGRIYNDLAYLYKIQGNVDSVLAYRKKRLVIEEPRQAPQSLHLANLYVDLASAYYDSKNYPQSILYYEKALLVKESLLDAKSPELATIYNNVGLAYAKHRQFPEAKRAFEKYQGIEPSSRVYRNWSMYFALQKKKKKALQNLQKAVELGYDNLKWITTDISLESIRGEPAYKAIIEQLSRK